MTMNYLPAATICVSDGVNNISYSNFIYERAVTLQLLSTLRLVSLLSSSKLSLGTQENLLQYYLKSA